LVCGGGGNPKKGVCPKKGGVSWGGEKGKPLQQNWWVWAERGWSPKGFNQVRFARGRKLT